MSLTESLIKVPLKEYFTNFASSVNFATNIILNLQNLISD